jgi:FkbM family methyltransferase
VTTGARVRDGLKVALTRAPRAYALLRRPYAVGRFWLHRPHDGDYEAFRLFADRPGAFLDVGANAGMSALSFRLHDRARPIVSVEPNPFHEADLRFVGRLVKPFRYALLAAGSSEGVMPLYVPVFRGVPLTSEASLRREHVERSPSLRARLGAAMRSAAFRIERVDVPVRRLDTLGAEPGLVKLDVQGFEYEALLGMVETIERLRPVLMVESPTERVGALLAAHGYEPRVYARSRRRLEPQDGPTVNVFYIPR